MADFESFGPGKKNHVIFRKTRGHKKDCGFSTGKHQTTWSKYLVVFKSFPTLNLVVSKLSSAGIFKQYMEARNRAGRGLSYRPARLHSLAELVRKNRFLGPVKV